MGVALYRQHREHFSVSEGFIIREMAETCPPRVENAPGSRL
jgi:hypothetical protein